MGGDHTRSCDRGTGQGRRVSHAVRRGACRAGAGRVHTGSPGAEEAGGRPAPRGVRGCRLPVQSRGLSWPRPAAQLRRWTHIAVRRAGAGCGKEQRVHVPPSGPPPSATLTLGTQGEGRPMKPAGAVGAPRHDRTCPPYPGATVLGEIRSDEKTCGRYGQIGGPLPGRGPLPADRRSTRAVHPTHVCRAAVQGPGLQGSLGGTPHEAGAWTETACVVKGHKQKGRGLEARHSGSARGCPIPGSLHTPVPPRLPLQGAGALSLGCCPVWLSEPPRMGGHALG